MSTDTETVWMPNIVNGKDIARLAGVIPSAVTQWAKRHDGFPSPAGRRWGMLFYQRGQVLDWLVATGRLTQADRTDWRDDR